MEYEVGKVVVYPHHGAAEITDIETRQMGDEELQFLVLKILQSDLTVRVPIKKVAEVVRDLWRRDQDKGLSAGEKRMLGKARHILVGELSRAKPVDDDKVAKFEKDMADMIARHNAEKNADEISDDVDLDDLSFDDED